MVEQHVLRSDSISLSVAPALGGRITELTDEDSGRQWLWRNETVPLGPVLAGSSYDDVWQGGLEELFPNDAPTVLHGVAYPDHGELWSIPWTLQASSETSITLTAIGPTTGVEVSKSVFVEDQTVVLNYRLEQRGKVNLHFLFKLHPAIAINEHCRIDLPGGLVEKVSQDFGNMLDTTKMQDWPTDADLAKCRSSQSETNEFIYVSDLPVGSCGVTDFESASWIRIDYPQETFPYCWVFMTYGGWRGYNVVVLEPCTNYPKDLSAAIARGSSAMLGPDESTEFELKISVGALDG